MEIEKIRQASVLLEEYEHLQSILKKEQEEKQNSVLSPHVTFSMRVKQSSGLCELPSHFNDAILELIKNRVEVLKVEIENL